MIEISVEMLVFKEAIRHNWNSYFACRGESMSPATQEAFSDIERALMRMLVLAPHGMEQIADAYRARVLQEILVQPIYSPGEMQIRYGRREPNGNFVWDEETMARVESDTEFHFYDFFDWHPFGYVDLPFVRVRTPLLPEVGGGKFALIEQRRCRFILNCQDPLGDALPQEAMA